MLQGQFKLRSFVKERVCQAFDTIDYALHHPQTTLRHQAHQETVAFITQNCPRAVSCRTPKQLIDIALNRVNVVGYYLEFGVFKGGSISYIAKKYKNKVVYGFDCFTGLPETWVHHDVDAFSLEGKLPKVPANVHLVKGYFDETLPEWLEKHPEKAAFVHVDCDLFSSTKTVLDCLADRLQPGTILLFDDYFNFPSWQLDGHLAFKEFVEEKKITFSYIGYSYKELAIRIDTVPDSISVAKNSVHI